MISTDARCRVLVGLLAIAAHATAVAGGFVWLDHAHIQEGLALARPSEWLSLFTRGFAGTGFYRPLMSVSLSVDAAIGGAPWLYHATTLAWHAAAAVMTTVAGVALGLSRRAALFAGILFAVHPATSLPASAIAFRSEAMIVVALLALVVLHLGRRPWGAAAALFCGALTKETALVLGPLFVAAIELSAPKGAPRDRRTRRHLLAAEAGAFVSALALRLAFAPPWRAPHVAFSPAEAVGTRLASLARSAALVLAPLDRTVCDAFPVTTLATSRAIAGAAVFVFIARMAWKRRGPALLLALALLPSLNLVPIMRWWSPHYVYLPLAFAAMLLGPALDRWSHRHALVLAVSAAIASCLAVVSARDDLRFRSDQTLWREEIASRPACREGHFYLAEAAREAHRWDEAAAHYERAVVETAGTLSYVDRGAALQNLGVVQLERGRISDAARIFRNALVVVAGDVPRRRLIHNLATAELRAGNAEEAANLLEPETRRVDAFPASILLRARALHELGREDEAGALVRRLQGIGTGATTSP